MRNYQLETKKRVAFIREVLGAAGAKGIVYGNSGGKDSALVGILCKMACGDTVGLMMPCGSKRNYETDRTDAEAVAQRFDIATRLVDLSDVKNVFVEKIGKTAQLTDSAIANIAPRLRMATLYAVAASENRLVAGTGNRSEGYMGYFTKWGDGACDFNPIADLTVTEIYEYLRHLRAPESILIKSPSAGLYDGQTDEREMGVTYRDIDGFLLYGTVNENDNAVIRRFHQSSAHKRKMPVAYEDKEGAV